MTWEESVLWLKSQPDRLDLVRDCFYDDPVAAAAQRYRASSEWAAVRLLLSEKQPGRVLDVGAGRGISSYGFSADGWEVTALEPDDSAIVGSRAIRDMCRTLGSAITVVEEVGEDLPFPSASFDLVYARAVLHHLKDLDQFGREVFRVLKPGGRFLFTREHVVRNEADRRRFLSHHPLHRLYGGENAYTKKRYLYALRESGLTVSKILGPAGSDINLFPQSLEMIRERVAGKVKLPLSVRTVRRLLRLRSFLSPTPGNLYSFYGTK